MLQACPETCTDDRSVGGQIVFALGAAFPIISENE